jgi:uncharacterized protein YndB with AHSA1/START domain
MTSTESPDGVFERLPDGNVQLRFSRRLGHPIERVWEALTSARELSGWWGDADVDLVEGGEFVMRWRNTDEEGNSPVMHARITCLEPRRVLETTGDLHGVLRWELSPDGSGGTLLSFSSTLELPDEHVASALAGWHWHLDALARVLEGRRAQLGTIDPAWERLRDRYASRIAI